MENLFTSKFYKYEHGIVDSKLDNNTDLTENMIEESALPALTGSSKQVDWANDIRTRFVARVNARTYDREGEMKDDYKLSLTKILNESLSECWIFQDDSLRTWSLSAPIIDRIAGNMELKK